MAHGNDSSWPGRSPRATDPRSPLLSDGPCWPPARPQPTRQFQPTRTPFARNRAFNRNFLSENKLRLKARLKVMKRYTHTAQTFVGKSLILVVVFFICHPEPQEEGAWSIKDDDEDHDGDDEGPRAWSKRSASFAYPLYCHAIRWPLLLVSAAAPCRSRTRLAEAVCLFCLSVVLPRHPLAPSLGLHCGPVPIQGSVAGGLRPCTMASFGKKTEESDLGGQQ